MKCHRNVCSDISSGLSCKYKFLHSIDVDECTTGGHNCHHNAICIDIQGSYTCQCKTGYSGDGFTCTSELCMWLNEWSEMATVELTVNS